MMNITDDGLRDRVRHLKDLDPGRPAEALRAPFWRLIEVLEDLSDLYPTAKALLESTLDHLETYDAHHSPDNPYNHF